MSGLALQIELPKDAGQALGPMLAALQDRAGLNRAAADAVSDTVRDHLVTLAGSRHKTASELGASPSGFWERMRNSVDVAASAEAGTVSLPREMALRYFGGTVRPTGGKQYLTIPAMAEAYGKRAGELHFLTFGFGMLAGGRMAPALVDRPRSGVSFPRDRRKGAGAGARRTVPGQTTSGGTVYFWLVRQATQKADKSVLPTEATMINAAQTGIGEFLASKAGGAN